jgi:hypothetical protein
LIFSLPVTGGVGGIGVLWSLVQVARPMASRQRQRQGTMDFFMDGVLGYRITKKKGA